MVSGQLNIVRTDVMGGSQSVAIKMLTGMYICICACTQLVYQTRQRMHENSHVHVNIFEVCMLHVIL